MRRFLLFLQAAIGVVAGSVFAQENGQLAVFESVLTSPGQYLGKKVGLHCIIDRVSAEHRTFSIIDAKWRTGDHARALFLTAAMDQGSTVTMPQNGQEAIVIGVIQKRDDTVFIQVSGVITNKIAVRRFLYPSAREPRPGDNLGRDAQPSDHLAE